MKDEMLHIREAMQKPGPVDVEGVISKMGLDIFVEQMTPDVLMSTQVHGMKLRARVNTGLTQARTRMLMAHAIGHHLLHLDLLNDKGPHFDMVASHEHQGALTLEHDAQANHFAISFLVPTLRLETLVSHGASKDEMAREFGLTKAFFERMLPEDDALTP